MRKSRAHRRAVKRPNARRLHCELLEDRRMLSITVDTLVDEADGSIVDGDISLRDAIALAPRGETIDFSVNGVLFLDGGGELVINKPLMIQGPGSSDLTVIRVGDQLRHFRIDDANASNYAAVTLSGITLASADMNGDGGAIHSSEALTLIDIVLSSNSATGDGGAVWSAGPTTLINTVVSSNQAGSDGGGLWVTGTLNVSGGRIEGNRAGVDAGALWVDGAAVFSQVVVAGNSAGDDGGGIHASTGLTLIDSALTGNSTTDDGGGLLSTGDVILQNSTVANNSAHDDGGGLWVTGSLDVIGSTLSGNAAMDTGGGLYIRGGAADFINSTISGNSVTGEYGLGGGLFTRGGLSLISSTVALNRATAATGLAGGLWNDNDQVRIENSILAENSAGLDYPDLRKGSGPLTVLYSIIGDTDGLTAEQLAVIDAGPGNLLNVDPLLGPLTNNGGSTLTHAPQMSSPAIDLGGSSVLVFDQRGVPYARVSDGDADGLATLDAGSVEVQERLYVVDTAIDESDGNHLPGDLSLREAIELANAESGLQPVVVTFAGHLNGAVINLSIPLGEMVLSRDLKTDASHLSGGVMIHAGHGVDGIPRTGDGIRIFHVTPGSDVELVNLTLTGGDIVGSAGNGGGAILSEGGLMIRNANITQNATTGDGASGGGMSGDVVLIDSVVSGNSTLGAEAVGGGIAGIHVEVTRSRIEGNATTGANAGGGGVWTDSGMAVTDSAIIDNQANGVGSHGGGVYLNSFDFYGGADVNLTRATISGNSSAGHGGGIFAGYYNGGVQKDVIAIESTISGNSSQGQGGGIFAGYGETHLINSMISGNSSGQGAAGVFSESGGSLIDSIVSDNSGIGIQVVPRLYGGPLTIRNTVVSNNHSGISFRSNRTPYYLTLVNSTVSGNLDFGVYTSHNYFDSRSRIYYSTIHGNGGVGVWAESAGDVILRGSIISGNSGGSFTENPGLSYVLPAFSMIDSNVGTDLTEAPPGSPDAFGNIVGGPINGIIDPMLGPLKDNGGPTFTHALLAGSPAIDAGDPNAVAGVGDVPEFDQRGAPYGRVENGNGIFSYPRIDIGAYEAPQVVESADFDLDGDVDGRDFMLWQRGGSPSPVSSGDLELWQGEYGSGQLSVVSGQLLGEAELGSRLRGNDESASSLRGSLAVSRRETASDVATVYEDLYTEEIDRALEQFATVPSGVRSFGEMVARRGKSRRIAGSAGD